jgi:hypothetical protein
MAELEMKVRAGKDELRKEVDELLRHLSGWSLQAIATPGAPPVWSFGSVGRTELTVGVDRGSISVYLVRTDREVKLGSTAEFVAWLQDREAESTPSSIAIVRPNILGEKAQPEVRVRAGKDGLRKEVDELLGRQPGWTLQAIATPGVPPVWCLGFGAGTELTVGVDGASICVYLMNSEREVWLGSTTELVAWLQDYAPESIKDAQGGTANRLSKRARFLEWQ